MVSNGGKQAITSALMATLDEGDEVVIPAPYWGSYPLVTKLLGGVPVAVNCPQNNGFRLRPGGPRRRDHARAPNGWC